MPAEPPDYRYRNMCVSGADLSSGDFDPETGELYGEVDWANLTGFPDSPPDAAPNNRPGSIYDQMYTGTVLGAKPPFGICMPMKDTQIADVSEADPQLAFSYYMNLDDDDTRNMYTVWSKMGDKYNSSNYYEKTSFFIGGPSGCPLIYPFIMDYVNEPDFKRSTIPERVRFRRFQAYECYKFVILGHTNAPWFTQEKVATATIDPLSHIDPDPRT